MAIQRIWSAGERWLDRVSLDGDHQEMDHPDLGVTWVEFIKLVRWWVGEVNVLQSPKFGSCVFVCGCEWRERTSNDVPFSFFVEGPKMRLNEIKYMCIIWAFNYISTYPNDLRNLFDNSLTSEVFTTLTKFTFSNWSGFVHEPVSFLWSYSSLAVTLFQSGLNDEPFQATHSVYLYRSVRIVYPIHVNSVLSMFCVCLLLDG